MSRNRRSVLASATKLTLGASMLNALPAQARQDATTENSKFVLTVRFQTPITPKLDVQTTVTTGLPFTEKVPKATSGFNAITGMLLTRKQGQSSYTVLLTLIDYQSDQSNTLSTQLLQLTPGKPFELGSVAGGVSSYTVTLTPSPTK